MPESLAATFEQTAGTMPQSQLGTDSWRLENDALAMLRQKLSCGRRTLKEVYGSPCRGVVTGLNDAFVVDRKTRDRLVAGDQNSANLLKPFLEGKDLKKWRLESQDLWLLYIPKNRVDINNYPTIMAHLWPHKVALEKRATKQAWFELQQAQEAFISKFESEKIFYPDMSQGSKFVCDKNRYFCGNTAYFIPGGGSFLLGLLNSSLCWFHLCGKSDALRGGTWRLRLFAENVETIPIPDGATYVHEQIASLAELSQVAAEERRDIQASFNRRVLTDLAPGGMSARLPAKLAGWPQLDFKEFHAELKRHFKTSIPLEDRDAWQSLFERNRAKVIRLTENITRNEGHINAAVYSLFELTSSEIFLIENSFQK